MLKNFPDPLIAGISGQPEALRRAARGLWEQHAELARIPRPRAGGQVSFTGMGGSYAACYAPVTTLGAAGVGALMVDSAELLYFRRAGISPEGLMVAVSQSGESAEVVRLVEQLDREDRRPFVVSVCNGLQNSLSRMADVSLDSRTGPEYGPSTMTFAAALVVLAAVCSVISGESLKEAISTIRAEAETAADSIERLLNLGDNRADRIRSWLGGRTILTLLSRGGGRATAEMAALTLKEAARFPAEAMESAQFRHGPLELVGNDAAVVIISTEPATQHLDARLASELSALGVQVLRIVSQAGEEDGLETISIGPVNRLLAPAPALVPLQFLAWRLALDRGLKPGTYARASKVTTHE